jgi:hypothetical protein
MDVGKLRRIEMNIQIGDYIKNNNSEGKVLGKVVDSIQNVDDVFYQTNSWMMYLDKFVEKASDEEAMLYMLEN